MNRKGILFKKAKKKNSRHLKNETRVITINNRWCELFPTRTALHSKLLFSFHRSRQQMMANKKKAKQIPDKQWSYLSWFKKLFSRWLLSPGLSRKRKKREKSMFHFISKLLDTFLFKHLYAWNPSGFHSNIALYLLFTTQFGTSFVC